MNDRAIGRTLRAIRRQLGLRQADVAARVGCLRRHDVKVRLAPGIWRERTGEQAASTVRLLVVAESSQNRRRLLRHAAIFAERYPLRGRAIRAWLAAPGRIARALWLLRP